MRESTAAAGRDLLSGAPRPALSSMPGTRGKWSLRLQFGKTVETAVPMTLNLMILSFPAVLSLLRRVRGRIRQIVEELPGTADIGAGSGSHEQTSQHR